MGSHLFLTPFERTKDRRKIGVTPLRHQLEAAVKLYEEIKDSPHPTDRLLGNFFHRNRKRFGSKDRKVISETIYGIFRHRLLIDNWLGKPTPTEYRGANFFWHAVTALACEGLIEKDVFTTFFGSKKAESLYDAFKEKKLPPGQDSLSRPETLSIRYSFPLWMVERWIRYFGEETEGLLQAMNERPPLVLRANPIRISRDELVARLRAKGHEAEPGLLSPWSVRVRERFNVFEIPEFKEGLFEVQDEGSQLVALSVNPQPGEVIWDTCAGGGGKTLLVAALMRNQGRVIATDIRSRKLVDLRKRAKRAGLFNIFPADLKRLGESKLFGRGVDKLLVDAPCSGTGTLRRNPDAKWKISPKMIQELRGEQLKILDAYVRYLKKGGSLVYATCSMEPEENEEVVDTFLKDHPEFQRMSQDIHLFPHRNGTDGFFISTLCKGNPTSLFAL